MLITNPCCIYSPFHKKRSIYGTRKCRVFFPLGGGCGPCVCCCAGSHRGMWPVPTGDRDAACARELQSFLVLSDRDAEGAKAVLKAGLML